MQLVNEPAEGRESLERWLSAVPLNSEVDNYCGTLHRDKQRYGVQSR